MRFVVGYVVGCARFTCTLFTAYVERNDVYVPPERPCYPDGERT